MPPCQVAHEELLGIQRKNYPAVSPELWNFLVSLVGGLLRSLLGVVSRLEVGGAGHVQEALLFRDVPHLLFEAVRELATWWWSHDKGYLGATLRCDRCGGRLCYKGDVEKIMVCPYGRLNPRRAYYVCCNPACQVATADGRRTRYSMAPLDRRLGLDKDHFLPCVQEVVVWLTSLDPYGKCLEFVSKLLQFTISQRTAWLITQQVGKRAQERQQERINAAFANPICSVFPAPQHPAPDIGVVELDGTCGRIDKSDDSLPGPDSEDPDAPATPPDFREVKVGLVAHLKPAGAQPILRLRKKNKRHVRPRGQEPTLANKKLAVHLGSPIVLFQALLLLVHQLGLTQARVIVVLGDGAHWIWRGVTEHFSHLGPRIVEILDFWHAVEHLWTLSHAIFGNGTQEAVAWVKVREDELLHGNLIAFFAALYKLQPLARKIDKARPAVGKEKTLEALVKGQIVYFLNNKTRIDYASYLSQGFLIGSGAMEGACKHHVKERIDRAGMRWGPGGVMAILRNRTLIKNGDWDEFWRTEAATRWAQYQRWSSTVQGA